jgi:hypothetical protein
VSVNAHRSSSPYQSALPRASRETTIPTRPSPTSATSPLEAIARASGALGRPAMMLIDHDHLRGLTAERDRPRNRLVLALAALGVALDLRRRRLAHTRRPYTAGADPDLAHRCSSRWGENARDRARQQPQDALLRRGRERLPHPIDPVALQRQGSWRDTLDASPGTGFTSSSCWCTRAGRPTCRRRRRPWPAAPVAAAAGAPSRPTTALPQTARSPTPRPSTPPRSSRASPGPARARSSRPPPHPPAPLDRQPRPAQWMVRRGHRYLPRQR